eukprot:TRINITY_DN8336_c0_g3_i2.p1 TRINITY_DN8336_c0_g3~~TRINITY_DN8336_c0_g3_i2.p1  ORF type:complete len:378 (-),score=111.29 TRINITY_DN8336_c0_g3_i2:88-1119(-)
MCIRDRFQSLEQIPTQKETVTEKKECEVQANLKDKSLVFEEIECQTSQGLGVAEPEDKKVAKSECQGSELKAALLTNVQDVLKGLIPQLSELIVERLLGEERTRANLRKALEIESTKNDKKCKAEAMEKAVDLQVVELKDDNKETDTAKIFEELDCALIREEFTVPEKPIAITRNIFKTVILKNTGRKEWPTRTYLVNNDKKAVISLAKAAPGEEVRVTVLIPVQKKPGMHNETWRLAHINDKGDMTECGTPIKISYEIFPDAQVQAFKQLKNFTSQDYQRAKALQEVFGGDVAAYLEFVHANVRMELSDLVDEWLEKHPQGFDRCFAILTIEMNQMVKSMKM